MGERDLRSRSNDLDVIEGQLDPKVVLTEAGVFGQARLVYEQAYQDMFVFEGWHGHNRQEDTMSMRSGDFQICQGKRQSGYIQVLIKLSVQGRLALSPVSIRMADATAGLLQATCAVISTNPHIE